MVSVIIPVYNTEAYAEQSIRSVINQTFASLEIILIDDGSEDSSLRICKRLKLTDERIQIISQKHQGVSAARNKGIEAAKGKYIFFMDSDDLIHPLLIEKLVLYAETENADLAMCGYTRLDTWRADSFLNEISREEQKITWETVQGPEAEEWFHQKKSLSGIGSKLIRRASIQALRFDRELTNGEDTVFLYHLICKQIRIVYIFKEWYCYRIYAESRRIQQFEGIRIIRNSEYEKGRTEYALIWERLLLLQMKKSFSELKRVKNKKESQKLKEQAAAERKNPIYRLVPLDIRLSFWGHIFCRPLYPWLSRHLAVLYKAGKFIKDKYMDKKSADIGILTFHCSDNYGAMLQAYGLKRYLREKGIKADIIRYEPPFMTGRHWWIPYVPIGGVIGCIWFGLQSWIAHLKMKADFFRLRSNMAHFRRKYLVEKGQKKLLFLNQLKRLSYRYYIVGSDQIWNPNITCGLRKAYFGAFENRQKEKVIAYAASLGSTSLSSKYDRQFSELLKYVNIISVREAEAVPYVKRFCKGDITAVLDPVFLLNKKDWEEIEKQPSAERYILVYTTEKNTELLDYARELAQKKGLSIVKLRMDKEEDAGFVTDYTAGPAEFLGYIHKADYVVTNSFHGVAFSIIYQKQFLVFQHSSLGARIRNALQIHGLENRVYERGREMDIDLPIDWDRVRGRAQDQVKHSEEFLDSAVRDVCSGKRRKHGTI